MHRWSKYLLFLLLILSMAFILTGCNRTLIAPSTTTTSPSSSTTTNIPPISPSVSNGQRIYNTATSASSEPITYSGGPGMMMPINLTCAECHGQDGHGGTVHFMMQTIEVPNITWPVLAGPDMDHPPYTEETLKRAITQGIDTAGNSLEYPMPRWQTSKQDLDDLVAFIKTLK